MLALRRIQVMQCACFSSVLLLSCIGCFKEAALELDMGTGEPTRSYRLFVPSSLPNTPVPLLIAIHGGDGRNYPFEQESIFEALAEEKGFIIAYPLSEKLPDNEGEWQLNTSDERHQDIVYMGRLIDQLRGDYSIDATRIYATGYSLGSMFTYELACHMSHTFAAIASHAGTMPVSPNACAPEENTPIMHLHGENDSLISYDDPWDWKNWDSVGTMMDIPTLIHYWKSKYACASSNEADSGDTVHTVHQNCEQNVRVEHHQIKDVGHEWPETIQGIPTPHLIWSFLEDFAKP